MRSTVRSPFPALLLVLAACGDRLEAPESTLVAQGAATDSVYGASAVENLRVVPVEVEVPGLPEGWDGMRIAAVSDFQLGLWDDNARVAEAALRRAVSLNPDVVVLLGDFVARESGLAQLPSVLAPLRGRTVLAVLGDRDQRDPGELQGRPDSAAIRIRQLLQESGVVVLENERGRVVRGGDTAYIAGIDPYVPRRPEWRQAEIFGAIPRGGSTPVLLSHTPAGVLAAPDSAYPLVLAGNTFCGRVEVPGAARLSWVNTQQLPGALLPGADRLYRVDGNGLFITCGVGYTFVPVRLGAPPEVALVTLRRPAGAADDEPARRGPDAAIDSLLRVYGQSGDSARIDTTAGG
ncbi:MAG TPA: metallophosphoesterase [Longimicrobiaceae bacterium]|nr:metallophosphoesterase [Longimicrobiaceae bacterium]